MSSGVQPKQVVSSVQASREAIAEATKLKGYKVSTSLLAGLKKQARAVAWNHTGDRVAVASDMTVYIFPSPHQKGRPGMKELQLTGHANAVNDLTWHPADPTILTSVSSDKTIRFWNVTTGKEYQAYLTPLEKREGDKEPTLNRVSWSPDASTILICGSRMLLTLDATKMPDKAIKTNRLRQEFQQTLFTRDSAVVIVATSSDVKGVAPGVIQIFRADNISRDERYELSCHTSVTTCLASDKQGKIFASGGGDGIINIWDTEEFLCSHSIANSDERVNSVSFSHDGKLIASACETHIFVNHVASGELVHTAKLSANSVAFHPSRYILAVVGEDDRTTTQATFARFIEFSSS